MPLPSKLTTLLLAHLVASYGTMISATVFYGWQLSSAMGAPFWMPYAIYQTIRHPNHTDLRGFVIMDVLYAVLLLATFKWHRQRQTSKFRPPGICEVCSYNLTGNTSGICPECGTAVAGKVKITP